MRGGGWAFLYLYMLNGKTNSCALAADVCIISSLDSNRRCYSGCNLRSLGISCTQPSNLEQESFFMYLAACLWIFSIN